MRAAILPFFDLGDMVDVDTFEGRTRHWRPTSVKSLVFIEAATNGIISHSEARRGGECKIANIFGLRPSAASHKKSTPIFAGAIVTIPLLVSKVVFFRGRFGRE